MNILDDITVNLALTMNRIIHHSARIIYIIQGRCHFSFAIGYGAETWTTSGNKFLYTSSAYHRQHTMI